MPDTSANASSIDQTLCVLCGMLHPFQRQTALPNRRPPMETLRISKIAFKILLGIACVKTDRANWRLERARETESNKARLR
jgi:hypothetical protein